jgi:hypothetical protein
VNNGCWQGNFTDKFSSLLQKIEVPRKEIAFGLGLPYSTLSKYLLGQIAFPPDLIEPLFSLTKDRRILEFFTKPCGYVLRRRGFSMRVVKEICNVIRRYLDLLEKEAA